MTQTLTLNYPGQNTSLPSTPQDFIPTKELFTTWPSKSKQSLRFFVARSTSRNNVLKEAYMNSYRQSIAHGMVKKAFWEETPMETHHLDSSESYNIVDKVVTWIGEKSKEINMNNNFAPYVRYESTIESRVMDVGFIEPSFPHREEYTNGKILKFEKEVESKVEIVNDFQFPSW